jgi:hypothetical protein
VRAPADGYTLLLANAANAINATLYEIGLQFHPRHRASCGRHKPPLSSWSTHRFGSRPFPNSSPMPKPIRVRSPWRRFSVRPAVAPTKLGASFRQRGLADLPRGPSVGRCAAHALTDWSCRAGTACLDEVDRRLGRSALSASSVLSCNASTVSVCSNARDKVELLSQTPRPHAERVLAAGELAIGGQIVLFECRSLATSLAGARVRSERE